MSASLLRVSVAALVRVTFDHPLDGRSMLALERKGTVIKEAGQHRVRVHAQPFGGAITFRDQEPLRTLIGAFQFDSERSSSENDFRILVQPSAWEAVRQFCLQHFADDDPVLDSSPKRELLEEFSDALGIELQSNQYEQHPVRIIIEDRPVPTGNPRALGYATVRIYRIFAAHLTDTSLAHTILANSDRYADQDLHDQAWADFQNGGRGRSNAPLALPLKEVTEAYQALDPIARNKPFNYNHHRLDNNVPAILDNVAVPIYQYL